MRLDQTTIVLRVLVLIILAVISQLAFHRRQYKIMFWSLAFWLTIFRILMVRVLKIYAHQDDPLVIQIQNSLMFGVPALVTDIILIVSAIPMFFWIKETYKVWVKESKKTL